MNLALLPFTLIIAYLANGQVHAETGLMVPTKRASEFRAATKKPALEDDTGLVEGVTFQMAPASETKEPTPNPAPSKPAISPAPVTPSVQIPSTPPVTTTTTTVPTPPAPTPPQPAPVTPPLPVKPSYPQCSSKEEDLRNMTSDLIGKDIFGAPGTAKTWVEDEPQTGGNGRFRLFTRNQVGQIEMIGSDGQSRGAVKFVGCAGKGRIFVTLNLAGLNFGPFERAGIKTKLLACTHDMSQIVFEIKKAPGGKISIADQLGACPHSISSTFSLEQHASAMR